MLGLSAWIEETVEVGQETSGATEQKCVGFLTANVAMARAETWDAALGQAMRIIFSA
jgi:hypothetical protein